ncbi:hypothetical protein PIB30_043432 [Stylosanthes scabra]|uniref:Uncharacterized protein n=1 Tax=Stylosanthes scabra TaxID=79078 RepID=A0ABU6UFT1_9FABA|nr:hypothetical protein [Stylosanthes scabra]
MMDPHKTTNTNYNLKGGVITNKGVGTPTNNLNTANPTTTTIYHKIPKIQDTNLHTVGNHIHQTTILDPLMKKHSDTSAPPPPPNPSPLPSQPLPNPKGGINVVEKENEKKEKRKARTEWLIELIAKANEMVESDDENWWDESDESDEEDSEDEDEEWEVEEENEVEVEVEKEDVKEEVVEKEQVNEALEEEAKIVEECGKLCLPTIFEGEKVHKPILPVKCEDPRPCLVTCEVRGISIPDCLCDPGACASVMPLSSIACWILDH